MAQRRRASASGTNGASGTAQYVKLEQWLVLLAWLNDLFGYEEKRGGGVSVPVEAFEGNNLIFVDEGHKGSGGGAWRSFRDALGETGFTFEYSATFGQALTAARSRPVPIAEPEPRGWNRFL